MKSLESAVQSVLRRRYLCYLLVMTFVAILPLRCGGKAKYGLHLANEHYLNCYFLTDAELVVKNFEEFEKQFDSTEFKELEDQVSRSKEYLQAEPIFLPIIQRVKPGNKYVLVFESRETMRKEEDYTKVKRLAVECAGLKDDLTIPRDCSGYYMTDDNNWPPDILGIIKGTIHLKSKSLVSGYLVGDIDLNLEGGKHMAGTFVVFDKNRSLFLSTPARHR